MVAGHNTLQVIADAARKILREVTDIRLPELPMNVDAMSKDVSRMKIADREVLMATVLRVVDARITAVPKMKIHAAVIVDRILPVAVQICANATIKAGLRGKTKVIAAKAAKGARVAGLHLDILKIANATNAAGLKEKVIAEAAVAVKAVLRIPLRPEGVTVADPRSRTITVHTIRIILAKIKAGESRIRLVTMATRNATKAAALNVKTINMRTSV